MGIGERESGGEALNANGNIDADHPVRRISLVR